MYSTAALPSDNDDGDYVKYSVHDYDDDDDILK